MRRSGSTDYSDRDPAIHIPIPSRFSAAAKCNRITSLLSGNEHVSLREQRSVFESCGPSSGDQNSGRCRRDSIPRSSLLLKHGRHVLVPHAGREPGGDDGTDTTGAKPDRGDSLLNPTSDADVSVETGAPVM